MSDPRFHVLITAVAEKEMRLTGHDWNMEPNVKNAMYTESIRRIQVWTFEHLADAAPDEVMRDMFLSLARGVRTVPETDLRLGESGVTGT